MKDRNPDLLWTLDIQYAMWSKIQNAQKEGKKCVFLRRTCSWSTSLQHSIACPFYLDVVPIRLSTNPALSGKFIDEARKYVPDTMCGIDAVELGVALCNQYGVRADAFVYSTLPCDSSRIAYPNMEKILGGTHFHIRYSFPQGCPRT